MVEDHKFVRKIDHANTNILKYWIHINKNFISVALIGMWKWYIHITDNTIDCESFWTMRLIPNYRGKVQKTALCLLISNVVHSPYYCLCETPMLIANWDSNGIARYWPKKWSLGSWFAVGLLIYRWCHMTGDMYFHFHISYGHVYFSLFIYSVINITVRHVSTHTEIDDMKKEKELKWNGFFYFFYFRCVWIG